MPSSGVQTCARSEEHTSELQSHDNLVCRLLLEKTSRLAASRSSPRFPDTPAPPAPPAHPRTVRDPGDHLAQRGGNEGVVVHCEDHFFLMGRPPCGHDELRLPFAERL